MNCPRCNSVAYIHNNVGSREFSITCETCGYHQAKYISHFSFDIPVFKEIELKPKGLIFTKKESIQYFSDDQKSKIMSEQYCLGYSKYENGKWIIIQTSSTSINNFILSDYEN